MGDPLHAQMLAVVAFEARCTPLVIGKLRESELRVRESGLASLAAPLERALAIFAHMQAAKQLWLSRVSTLTGFPDGGVFPNWTLEVSERVALDMDGLWAAWLEQMDAESLGVVVRYTSTENVSYESTRGEIVTHVVNHSSYHRGQIAALLAQTGTRPASTDYITLTRRRV
ncbi:MAG: hypothetical protein K2W85_08115 [Phycisphaerales bacterium]|nr:hypothetical protein [Phycisphaerales bacterium]